MNPSSNERVESSLEEVRVIMTDGLGSTPLRKIMSDCRSLLGNGKMLRARLAVRGGPAANVPHPTLLRGAATVELIHAASLLHDDVIDGGYLRRGLPTFWVERGIPGAILLGDLMLFKALDLLSGPDDQHLVPHVIKLTGEVCEAESEQELVMRGKTYDWESCVAVARRKTGPLFAFAGHVSGGKDKALCAALREAGYLIGTAYQLADDILDANGTSEAAGKTLGSDEARDKATVARVKLPPHLEPVAVIDDLCEKATRQLSQWPDVQRAWNIYVSEDIRPALDKNLGLVKT